MARTTRGLVVFSACSLGACLAAAQLRTNGNYNETIHRHGKNRQFRGKLRAIEIFGSRIGPAGARSVEAIRKRQEDR